MHATASLLIATRAGEVCQNPPHQLSTYGKEMCAVLPVDRFNINQPQVNFIDERCGLKSVSGSFPDHITSRCPMQFVIYQRRESR